MKLAWLTRRLNRRHLDRELVETEAALKKALGVERLERPRLLGIRRW